MALTFYEAKPKHAKLVSHSLKRVGPLTEGPGNMHTFKEGRGNGYILNPVGQIIQTRGCQWRRKSIQAATVKGFQQITSELGLKDAEDLDGGTRKGGAHDVSIT